MADMKKLTPGTVKARLRELSGESVRLTKCHEKNLEKIARKRLEIQSRCPHEHTTRGRCGEDSFFTCDDCGKEL